MARPWSQFSVGTPSTRSNWTEPDCQPLKTVSHVAHVPVALRIAEDARLRADLVFDKSKLNTERIRVVWLSPNDWSGAGGSRYGNVRFTFDWLTLLGSKKAFWVESIAYGIEACRILVTDTDYSSVLDPYDPTVRDGPWWVDAKGQHHWNGNFCLEIMVEGDLAVANAMEVDFVEHHQKRCNVDYKTCRYCGWTGTKAGAEFLGLLASTKAGVDLPGLTRPDGIRLRLSHQADAAVAMLLARLRKWKASGAVTASDSAAPSLARALLRALADSELSEDREQLASLFASQDDAYAAVATLVAEAFGLPDANALTEMDGD